MKIKIAISIPKPCHENWDGMIQVAKGRFCSSCQKQVFDFTKASDRTIAEAFRQNENLCGRFLASQLNRELINPKQKNSFWIAAATAFVTFTGLGTQEALAQGEPKILQTDIKSISEKTTPANDSILISGTVVSKTDKMALPGVNVFIKNSPTAEGVQTDFDGKFHIYCTLGTTLVFSFSGTYTQEFTVAESQALNVQMVDDKASMPDLIVGGAVARRTFFGRIFHAIGNIFR